MWARGDVRRSTCKPPSLGHATHADELKIYPTRPQYEPFFIPNDVKSFVDNLHCHINDKNVNEIHEMYDTFFHMFKDMPWPCVEAVGPYVDTSMSSAYCTSTDVVSPLLC